MYLLYMQECASHVIYNMNMHRIAYIANTYCDAEHRWIWVGERTENQEQYQYSNCLTSALNCYRLGSKHVDIDNILFINKQKQVSDRPNSVIG